MAQHNVEPTLANRVKLWKSSRYANIINAADKTIQHHIFNGKFEGQYITNLQVTMADPRSIIDKVVLTADTCPLTYMNGRNHASIIPKGTWFPIDRFGSTTIDVVVFPRNAKYVITYTSCIITNEEHNNMIRCGGMISMPGAIPLLSSDGKIVVRYTPDINAKVYKHRL